MRNVDQVNSGIRRILEFPAVYSLFKRMVARRGAHQRYVDEFVQPFAGARILDIGCGPATILAYLPEDIEYHGYDMNPTYISAAQRRFGDRGHFTCARVSQARQHSLAGEFDFVLAGGILHHLSDEEADTLVCSAHDHLKPGGVLCTLDNVYVPDQSAVARFLISRDRGRHVRTPPEYLALFQPYFATVESRVLTDPLRIPYTHFRVRAIR